MDKKGDSMNSQMKEALNDFINSNTSAIEQAMENGNHDLGKDEPAIQDLMNYLSCPTLPSCHKDSQPMSVDEKTPIQNPEFNPANLHIVQHPPFNSPQLQGSPGNNQFSIDHMCVSNSDTNYITDTSLNLLSQDQQFHQRHDSFEQNRLYPDSNENTSHANADFTDVQLVNSSTFDGSSSHQNGRPQSSDNETQYYHSGQSVQFQHPTSSERHYHHTLEAQLTNTENGTGQFQSLPQAGTSDFKDSSSVLASSFASSSSSAIHYDSIQDNLGYGLMEVHQTSHANLDTGASQFRAPEKMHVDEPEVIFHQANSSESLSRYQSASVDTGEAHLQTYSSEGFNADSTQGTAQASTMITQGLSECDFQQKLNSSSASHPSDDTRVEPSNASGQNSSPFDIAISSYHQPSVSSPFSSQNFQQSPPVPVSLHQESAVSDFQEQPGLCQVSVVNIDSAHYISQQSGSAGFSVSSSSSPSQINHSSSQSSPYQGNQYQESPGQTHTSPIIPDSFQLSGSGSSPPSLGFNQKHQLRQHNSFDSALYQQPQTSSPLDCGQYQQNSTVDSDYCRDTAFVNSTDQHPVSFQSNVASPLDGGMSYSTSVQDGGLNQQQQGYLSSSIHSASSQLSDPSDFMGFNSHKDAVLSTEITTAEQQNCGSQTLTNFEISGTSSQGQTTNDSTKTSSDVTMREFSSAVGLDSFSHLDLETVVNSFSVETPASSVLQSSPSISAVLDPPGFGGYEYSNMSSDSSGFPETTRTTADVNNQLSFNQESHSDPESSTFIPTLSTATIASEQDTVNQFASSGFGLSSPSAPVVSENYPQPMQVVHDADIVHKIPEHCTTFSYQPPALNEGIFNNAETAMDISSSLVEKSHNMLPSISFEEIHMSIVKAGDALSKSSEVKNVDQHSFFDASSNIEASESITSLYSTSSGIFHTEPSHIAGVASYDAGPQTSSRTSSSVTTSETVPDQAGLSREPATYVSASNTSVGNSGISGDENLITSILNIQASSTHSNQLLLQDQATKQQNITVPNFLENPGTLGSRGLANNSDSVILMQASDIKDNQPQAEIPATMIAPAPAVNGTLIVNSGSTRLNTAVISNASTTTGQTPDLSLMSGLHSNQQVLGAGMNLLHSVDSSFVSQPGTGVASHVSGADGGHLASPVVSALSLNPLGATAGTTSATASTLSSGVFLQLATPQTDNKTSASSGSVNGAMKLGTATSQQPAPKSNTGGITFVVLQTGNPSPAVTSTPTSQPQITVSLEDLQKLLAQQNLSQPSPLTSQKQPYTSLSSPQTLVIQKHASHSLRQGQPRLLIKGATLPSPSRLAQPHQQLQQTREKLQLLMHQTHSSEQIPTGTLPQRNPEHTAVSATQENRQNFPNPFQLSSVSQRDQQKLQLLQQSQAIEQAPKIQLQLKKTHIQQQQQTVNVFLQQIPKPPDQKLTPLQLLGHQQFVLTHNQQQVQPDQKHGQNDCQSHQHLQQGQNIIHLAQMQQELQQLQKQQEKEQELEGQQLKQFHQQHLKSLEKPDRTERPCSDNLKKDYKHLHSLLTGETPNILGSTVNTQAKGLPSVLNLPSNLQGQLGLRLSSGSSSGNVTSATSVRPQSSVTQASSTPFSFLPLNSFPLQLTNSNVVQPTAPLTTQAFMKAFATSTLSKSFDGKDIKTETIASGSQFTSLQPHLIVSEEKSEKNEQDTAEDSSSNRQASILAQILTERKRSHTPLSVDLNSPANSNSEPASPLSSPTVFEDGNTQLTLIERSADLHIKSDTMHSLEDDDENANFDLNAFHKRPSAIEFHSARGEKSESVPMKIAKPSINTDASTIVSTALTQESTFDFGNAASSTSNFSFNFGNKDENNSEIFTFGLSSAALTNDTLQNKDGSKHYRTGSSKPTAKAIGIRSAVPTQPVRPQSRKQKEYSLKAYYSSKLDSMELKILEQPEPQHRARYQTEGSRGAIKDASQQGFPVIKLFGYNKATKLQVFIGDECGRVKPHGFYQACRVCGKNSTPCVEQEIEGTMVIEIDMQPENDMTVKLDCIGILKLRNADVERRIGPKRARDKKRTNTRARLVMRCMVEKSDGSQHILQVVSNPIVCTQPVGQPEISRMSLAESSVRGGESLFIIGKNFKNKGTSVLFQKLDPNDENVVWQAEAEIEQEFFQPTHLICKIPPYKDQTVDRPQAAQIVVSCAGKKSDSQSFIYKPVYPVAPSVKQETLMETDTVRPLPFVSPEALHLNRMVQQTHAQSSTSANIFQLPPGTIPAIQTVTVTPPATSTSVLVQPNVLVGCDSSQVDASVLSPVTTAASSVPAAMALPASSGSSYQTLAQVGQSMSGFVSEEKSDELELKPLSNLSVANVLPSSANSGTVVNCIVHSNSNTNTVSPMSYAVSGGHPETSLTSSSSAGRAVCSDTPASANASLPSKPFFVVVDPTALQANVGGDIIQQLLQQILEAQSKVW